MVMQEQVEQTDDGVRFYRHDVRCGPKHPPPRRDIRRGCGGLFRPVRA